MSLHQPLSHALTYALATRVGGVFGLEVESMVAADGTLRRDVAAPALELAETMGITPDDLSACSLRAIQLILSEPETLERLERYVSLLLWQSLGDPKEPTPPAIYNTTSKRLWEHISGLFVVD